ncbi:MAG: hypothetical protein QY310_10960 [Candidatus Jettenia sp. CY-1]|nr:hypothetical protein [Candidatus Jettenia sp.]WKZ17948.1 MAG: hypothetical protein QY310_10960 [Candidatus Jettenia sp. CY-1]
MSTILKDDVLREKHPDNVNKEKIDKIMNTIVDQSKTIHGKDTEVKTRTSSDPLKSKESKSVTESIFSKEILIDGENEADLDELRNRLTRELKPSNEIESIIADRIISSMWRLKRCLKIEGQIMDYAASCIQEYEQGFFRTRKRTNVELKQLKALKIAEDKTKLKDLSEYETMLERQIYRALGKLSKLKKQESKQERIASRKSK